jgi:hypothetical protein
MQARHILVLVAVLLIGAAVFKSARARGIDLQSRIWLMTGTILLAVSAWLWSTR